MCLESYYNEGLWGCVCESIVTYCVTVCIRTHNDVRVYSVILVVYLGSDEHKLISCYATGKKQMRLIMWRLVWMNWYANIGRKYVMLIAISCTSFIMHVLVWALHSQREVWEQLYFIFTNIVAFLFLLGLSFSTRWGSAWLSYGLYKK